MNKILIGLLLLSYNLTCFAEISDKMPSFEYMIGEYIFISVLCFFCVYKKYKLRFIVIPISFIFAYINCTTDFGVGDFYKAVIDEMGKNYAYFRWYGLIILLFISTIGGFILRIKMRREA
ncbi:MAG: hypothetical protein RLZZ210_608 [Pseudomonadota bacterium]